MFCSLCNAEYREGFARCSNCDVELVEAAPQPEGLDPQSFANDRPNKAPLNYFLAWFVPMGAYLVLIILTFVRPDLIRYSFVLLILLILTVAGNIGGFWMLYQAIRYEKRVARYTLLSFVPFMFIWYLLVRYPLRRELPRLS
jgi:hypothetical protein